MSSLSSTDMQPPVHYQLRLLKTDSGIGYFSAVPTLASDEEPDYETALAHLRRHPDDAFMRHHLHILIGNWPESRAMEAFERILPEDTFLNTLFLEVSILFGTLPEVIASQQSSQNLQETTPLIYLKAEADKDRSLQRQWIQMFAANIRHHAPLNPEAAKWPIPVSEAELAAAMRPPVSIESVSIKKISQELVLPAETDSRSELPPAEMLAVAHNALNQLGIPEGPEMRHEASLSPIGLLRKWRIDISVNRDRRRYRLSGEQTAYGRGIDLDAARAALAMEIVERYSSFADVTPEGVIGYKTPYPLSRARYSEISADGIPALDPNTLCLETGYRDEPLYWLTGETPTGSVRIPAQCVFLFFDLDETQLFSALGSTGLASGASLDAAKVSALLEVIERDADATTPFHPSGCFAPETRDPRLNALFSAYRAAGIHVRFQDITPATGVPCCKCFVRTQNGDIVKGTSASLSAQRALVSAMTETPYPFPNAMPSGGGTMTHIRVPIEGLPDYSTGHPAGDLRLLESLLEKNGYTPIYVNLTRSDTEIPVVRAIVPGMEILGDLDRFSRVHPKLYHNYRKLTDTLPGDALK